MFVFFLGLYIGIAGSYSNCMFNFFSNSRVFSKAAVPFYIPINSV